MTYVRAFFAVAITGDVKDSLLLFSSELKKRFPPVRPVARENMHITLLFLGTVKENQLRRLLDDPGVCGEAHRLSVEGIGFFGSPHSPRVVWAGCSPAGKLKSVSESLVKASKYVGIVPDDREFHPHITVARLKGKIDGGQFQRFLSGYEGRQFGSVEVKGFTLYRSDLSPSGPRYTALKEFYF